MNRLIIFLLIVMFTSCRNVEFKSGNRFVYKSHLRILEIKVLDDSTCTIENEFLCNDLDEEIRNISIHCSYFLTENMIILKNQNCINAVDCSYDLMYPIPNQSSHKCDFLNLANERNFKNYVTEFKKFGAVPNIDIDTLKLIKRRLLLYKQNSKESIGFYLKAKKY